jgi:hypothetical protein
MRPPSQDPGIRRFPAPCHQVIGGDVAAEITQLKQAPGRNSVQCVSRLLLEHGLLDELRLWCTR